MKYFNVTYLFYFARQIQHSSISYHQGYNIICMTIIIDMEVISFMCALIQLRERLALKTIADEERKKMKRKEIQQEKKVMNCV